MEEIWKYVKGFEGLYQVSNKGNVKSLNYHNTKKEKILKPIIGKGYKRVRLYKNKTSKLYAVHRLVANAFLPNPHKLPCINHKDECRTNNVVSNLEWCTQKYNCNYGTGIERSSKARSKQVGAFKNCELVFTFSSTREAERQGFKQGAVASCCRGERKSHKGYIWSYTPLI